jgi:uncharacterized membrane protein YvbJ
MKKCPYCAEDIQDEAKKCKHCGEWLTASQDGKLIIDELDAVQKEIKKDEVNADLKRESIRSIRGQVLFLAF